ncbi:MAG TPA: nucleoside-diphosphate sugar epimerase/dehydratase [Acetobacteraceae bacterium]
MAPQHAPPPSLATRPMFNRILVNVLLDGALAAVATPLARYVADPGGGLLHPLWFVAGGAITLLLAGLPFRMPQQYWRFAGIEDLVNLVLSSVASAALFALLLRVSGFPLPTPTFPVVHALVLIVALGTPRVVYRLQMARRRTRDGAEATQLAVLLVGAGDGADLFLRALEFGHGRISYRVLGLLSLRQGQTGRRIHGHAILGDVGQTAAVLARLRAEGRLPSALVVTQPDLAGPVLAGVLAQADAEGVPVRRVPRPTALQSAGGADVLELAPVAIEDLLNRPQVPLDRDGMAALVRGRRVIVTGAGGTIGSELARQCAALDPSELVLLDNGEYALWSIEQELAEAHPGAPRRTCIADVRDSARIEEVFAGFRPDLVFHAAALKHVPMGEANPTEDLLTNTVGTRHVADAARASGARAMVLISTDKAVNPSSVMGASKRLAEMYCQALDMAAVREGEGAMRCVTVRFGNVLGSTGSVVPLFRRQLERGGPLTVTHPEMRRYFMTVREAVGLVLQASVLGVAGAAQPGTPGAQLGVLGTPQASVRRGGIFVLDMGEPVRIVDLARQMIRLAGLQPAEDGAPDAPPDVPGRIRIRFTGLRPGEKLYEELFHGSEPPAPTGHPGLLMATPRTTDAAAVGDAIARIAAACRAGHAAAALALLGRMVPEFDHAPGDAAARLPAPIPGE